jgi:hypothetical protein
LPAPFAPVAGIGDIITGSAALFLALALVFGFEVRRLWIVTWNGFGVLDLFAAVTLATLSAFRVFTDGSGMQTMATLPWVLVPSMLVPVDFLAHFAIAAKLKSQSRSSQLVAAVN